MPHCCRIWKQLSQMRGTQQRPFWLHEATSCGLVPPEVPPRLWLHTASGSHCPQHLHPGNLLLFIFLALKPCIFQRADTELGTQAVSSESCTMTGLTVSSAFLQVAGQWPRRFCKIERWINQIHRYFFFCKLIMKIEALNIKCPSRHPFLQENPWGFSIHQTRKESYRLVLPGHASQAPRKAEQFSQTPPRLFIQVAL